MVVLFKVVSILLPRW